MTGRTLISIALIIGFSTIAIFGAFGMGQSIGGQNACIAATASGLDCLAPSNLASIASMYLGAFGTFSSAFFFALAFLILFVTGLIAFSGKGSVGSPSVISFLRRVRDIARLDVHEPALSWISIHENSPSRR